MEWYVYRHDTNKGTIYKYNVLQPYIIDQIKNKIKEPITLSNFKEILKREMQYYYWGKSEHEVVIKEWCGTSAEKKIDIFDQLQLNWEVFVIYVWNSLLEKEEKSKEEKNPCKDCYCKDCANAHEPLMCSGCGYCTNGDDKIEIGDCYKYMKEDIEDTEEEEVQREDICKDCLCRTCKAVDCVGCDRCTKADHSIFKECICYKEKEKEIPGYWVHDESGDIICNKCQNYPLESNGRVYLSDYCPFCGVHMENCKGGEIV